MPPLAIFFITLISALIIYLLFLAVGFIGVQQNRKAQGIDSNEIN